MNIDGNLWDNVSTQLNKICYKRSGLFWLFSPPLTTACPQCSSVTDLFGLSSHLRNINEPVYERHRSTGLFLRAIICYIKAPATTCESRRVTWLCRCWQLDNADDILTRSDFRCYVSSIYEFRPGWLWGDVITGLCNKPAICSGKYKGWGWIMDEDSLFEGLSDQPTDRLRGCHARRGKKRRQMKTERRIQIEAFKLPVLSLLTLFTLVCTLFTLLFLMPSCHLSSPFQSAFSSPLLYASTAPLHYFVSCLPAPLPAQLRWYKVWRQLLKTWGIK